MAYLNKSQYNRRQENAKSRNIDNEAIAIENGMTQEQANLISRLCAVRHELHTNMDHVVKCDDSNIKKEILNLNSAIHDSGLGCIESIPSSNDDYIDIDTIEELYEIDNVPESGTKEWQEWYDDNYYRIYEELERLNKDIEHYLALIDSQYLTHFEPTGLLRIL